LKIVAFWELRVELLQLLVLGLWPIKPVASSGRKSVQDSHWLLALLQLLLVRWLGVSWKTT
jgi:hypothetical protein